jgi:2-dehydro-3-deoxygluconokinase
MAATDQVFLGLGECMVELAATGQPETYRQGFAGDVFNTLWYAARCLGAGWRVRMHTALGVDQISDELAAFAAGAGVDVADVPRLPGAMPGLYMIRLDRGERRFLYWRGQSAARRMLEDPAHVDRQIAAARVVYLSGITLAILPPGDRARLIDMMAQARTRGQVVAFDPNIRPALWEDAAALGDTLTRAAGAASVVLPSFDDEALAFGDTMPGATVARYHGAGCPLVVVKNGAGPVVTGYQNSICAHSTPALDGALIDSTAAGDSFNAAFLAAWLRSPNLAEAVLAGQALAANVIKGHGALVHTAPPPLADRIQDQ